MTLSLDCTPELLAKPGPDQESALAALRTFLLKAVRKSLSGRAGADSHFIEDVVQLSLVRILKALDTFEGRSAFSTWALTITVRIAFSELRKKHWKTVSLDELRERSNAAPAETPTVDDNPHQAAARKEFRSSLHALIKSELTPHQQDYLLAALHGMPQDDIANRMNLSRNAVYKVGHDARKALKRALEQRGFSLEKIDEIHSEPDRPTL